MAFTREWLLLKYATTYLAFEVLAEEYGGGEVDYLQQISRSKTGALLRIKGGTKRRFMGFVVFDVDATGTISYDDPTYGTHDYYKGKPSYFYACIDRDDLEVKSFEDTTFWYGVITSVWNPKVVYDLLGKVRVMEVAIEER